MLSIISSSLAGLYAATDRASRAAERIASAGVRASEELEAATLAAGNRSYTSANTLTNGGGATPLPPTLPAYDPPSPDAEIVYGFANLMLAEHAYKANTAVLKTADQMLGRLLDNDY